jgi:hypothetical protein
VELIAGLYNDKVQQKLSKYQIKWNNVKSDKYLNWAFFCEFFLKVSRFNVNEFDAWTFPEF